MIKLRATRRALRLLKRSLRFMNAYRKGLNGHQAAWAAKKYRSHCVIPATLLADLEKVPLAVPKL